MLSRIPSRLFSEWMAYYSIEPWGEERADLRAGHTTAAVSNTWRSRGQPLKEATDYILGYEQEAKQSTTLEQMKNAFRGFVKRVKRVVKRDGDDRKTGGNP